MLLLLGTLLRLLIPINLSAYKEKLQPFATVDFSKIWDITILTDRRLRTKTTEFSLVFMGYHNDNLLESLNLKTLHNRYHHFDALFLINVFSGTKCCPSVLETVGILVPTKNIRNCNMLTCSSSHCPSARCVSTENSVYELRDVCGNSCMSVKSLN
jgi:hypothetical protein